MVDSSCLIEPVEFGVAAGSSVEGSKTRSTVDDSVGSANGTAYQRPAHPGVGSG
jgi:hypothetical protein